MLTLLFDKQFWISMLICFAIFAVLLTFILKPKSRPWISLAVCLGLAVSTIPCLINLNRYYSAQGGISGLISSAINKENKGDLEDKTFSLKNIMLSLDEEGNYSAKIMVQKKIEIEEDKTYGVYINNSPCGYADVQSDYILAKYSYNFYDKDRNVFNDVLELYFIDELEYTSIEVLTRGGSEAVKHWNFYFNRNKFEISLKEVDQPLNYEFDIGTGDVSNYAEVKVYLNNELKETQIYEKGSKLMLSSIEETGNEKKVITWLTSQGKAVNENTKVLNNMTIKGTHQLSYICDDETKTATIVGANTKAETVNIEPTVYKQGVRYTTTKISSQAFKGYKYISSIFIPRTIIEIGANAFSGCEKLTSATFENASGWLAGESKVDVSVATKNSEYLTQDYVSNEWKFSLLEDTEFENIEFTYNDKDLTASVKAKNILITSAGIPENVIHNDKIYTITSIDWYGFLGCSKLQEVSIPGTITEISYGAFNGCESLSSINIPNSVTRVGTYAFSGCTNLKKIIIPSSVTKIGHDAFLNAGLVYAKIERFCYYYEDADGNPQLIVTNSVIGSNTQYTTNAKYLTSLYVDFDWET